MIIELAQSKDMQQIAKLDSHISPSRLKECILSGNIYVLKDDSAEEYLLRNTVAGVLRYSLFWQTIPFLDLLYIDKAYRKRGFGTKMMNEWENAMADQGYEYVMTSTQADEEAWRFYEYLGYQKAGGFFPPEQEAEEWIYRKRLRK